MDRSQATAATVPAGATATQPRAPEPVTGAVLGRYTLQRRLGSGGFGTVWLGRDERLERAVAVKVVPRERMAPGRRWREALAAARLAHPAIVALYEAGTDDEAAYLVSELVRGETLDALLADGLLSDRDVAAIGVALAGALGHAHNQGVIHRDVKPANIIVPDDGGAGGAPAKLTDFGVAHVADGAPLTRTGDVVGTLAYMAPEQAEGRPATPAADLWALALVVHEALAGTNPVRAASPAATARRLAQPVPPLARRRRDLPPELCAAVDRALDLEPVRRGTVADLRRALTAAAPDLADEPGLVAPGRLERLTGRPGTAELPRLRLPARLGAAAGAGALAAGAVAAARAAPDLGASVPLTVPAAGVVAAGALILPRVAWLVAAWAAVGWLAAVGGWPGAAVLLVAALASVPVLLPRAPAWWSLPAAAPALGLVGLAVAFPVLAGQARTLPRRAALGALGAWWLLLAEALADRRLLAGPPVGTPPAESWRGAVTAVGDHVLGPLLSSPLVLLVAGWALAAAVLPWFVRGRGMLADVAGALMWAVARGVGALALPGGPTGAESALGAAAAAVAALALVVLAPRPERERDEIQGPFVAPASP